jgi:hypothetical protein
MMRPYSWQQDRLLARLHTLKASNFGLHGNLGLFQKSLLLSKRVLQKNEWNKSCRQAFDLQSGFWSFLAHNSPKEAVDLARNGPKFPWGPKLEAFTVLFFFCLPFTIEFDLESTVAPDYWAKEWPGDVFFLPPFILLVSWPRSSYKLSRTSTIIPQIYVWFQLSSNVGKSALKGRADLGMKRADSEGSVQWNRTSRIWWQESFTKRTNDTEIKEFNDRSCVEIETHARPKTRPRSCWLLRGKLRLVQE